MFTEYFKIKVFIYFKLYKIIRILDKKKTVN